MHWLMSVISKFYLHIKDPNVAKYKYFINKCENIRLKELNDLKTFAEYSNDMQDPYKNIEEYNPSKKCNVLIVFHDMIAGTLSNKKCNPIVSELFIRGRKLNICLVFITQFILIC